MKRRKLCNTKKLIAVILAASMVMGTGATAFANDPVDKLHIDEDVSKDSASVFADKEFEFDSDLGAKADMTVGDVESGIDANSVDVDNGENNNAEASVTVDGDVSGSVHAHSISYSQSNTSASTEVTIKGSVDVDGYTAVSAEAVSKGSDSDASTTVIVEKDVISSGDYSTGVSIAASEKNSSESNSSVKVSVGGDVTAADTAVNIFSEQSFGDETSGSIELTVEGTISGGKHNIVIDDNVSLEDVSITVWKVDTSDDKNVVDKADGSQYAAAEKTINYIIKADSKDTQIALSGQGGYDKNNNYVANQGDKVYFKVDIPSGYSAEFYDINNNSAYQINSDGSSGAYIAVPRGGGVYVGVRLTRTSTDSDSYSGSGSDSDSDYWSSGNNDKGNVGGLYAGFEALQGLQVHSTILGGSDVAQNIADVLTPVDTLSAMNNFEGTSIASIDMNNVMGAGVVNFNNMFVNSISDTVDVPVPANVVANQSYTVMFSDGTSIVVPCLMNGVLSIPFKKGADGLTYIICKTEVNPSMFMGMPPVGGWTY